MFVFVQDSVKPIHRRDTRQASRDRYLPIIASGEDHDSRLFMCDGIRVWRVWVTVTEWGRGVERYQRETQNSINGRSEIVEEVGQDRPKESEVILN